MTMLITVAVALITPTSGSATGHQPQPTPSATAVPHEHDVPNPDPIGSDAAELATDAGVSADQMRYVIELQPDIGRLEAALTQSMPTLFGGTLLEYQPDFRIVLLSPPGYADRVRESVDKQGFSHLRQHITVRETPYTRPTLLRAVARVKQLGEGRVTSTDIDLTDGTVQVTAATEEDVNYIRQAVERNRQTIEARAVEVVLSPPVGEETESYGGLKMDHASGDEPCTSGFSVRRTTDDALGVSQLLLIARMGITHSTNIAGTDFNPTFIEVRDDDTLHGDSGGPLVLGNSAYGIHKMSDPSTDHPVFMAQNFLSALNLVVRIN
jgi:hypothetical protein